MKKVLALVLAVVLVIGMAVTASADITLVSSLSDKLPALADGNGHVTLLDREGILNSAKEIHDIVVEANEALPEADTKGLALKEFFYVEIPDDEEHVSVTFDPIPANEILFMQYIDHMWVELEHHLDDDGNITLSHVEHAPFAIFTDGKNSPGGSFADLLPILTEESHLIVQLHTLDEITTLSEDIQKKMAEAKAVLEEACPEGFAVKYFFEIEVLGTESAVSVDFEPIECSEIVFKQYVDGAWVELESSAVENGIITVSGLVNGPVATFTK